MGAIKRSRSFLVTRSASMFPQGLIDFLKPGERHTLSWEVKSVKQPSLKVFSGGFIPFPLYCFIAFTLHLCLNSQLLSVN